MSVQAIVLKNQGQNFQPVNRTLGFAAMLFSPMLYFASQFYAPDSVAANPYQIYASVLGILYLSGATASATAMRNLRVMGSGTGAKILYIVQMTGLLLAMSFDFIEYAAPQLCKTWAGLITDLAYPFSHLLMIVVGIAVVRAKVWHGWRLIPAFAVGFALPIFILGKVVFGIELAFFVFPVLVGTGFFGLGYAVASTKN